MNEKTVDEVYAANAAIREKLRSVVEPLDENKLNNKPEGEKWSVGDIVEHLSMVEGSIVRVCGKLLAKAENENRMGDGLIRTSDNFAEKGVEVATVKVEAPEFVRPTGGRPIADS
ncbi:MAG: DinB family protein, partial [Pyrinomonadaceae bacterium]